MKFNPCHSKLVCVFILMLFFMHCRGLLTHQDEVDKAQIKKLHSTERDAIKDQDYETLQSLWMEDGVMLPPDNSPIRGIKAITEWNHAHKPEPSMVELIQLDQDIQESQRFGTWAFEWGIYESTVQMIETGDTLRSSGKMMRILQKDTDGTWKIARSMWNEN
ncbi:nuclear transport factor 2 family protein [candidate division KSB1 bacterium]|nr:nuclear transport factor 2 family protein [candidate division KSB1 bacterium]